MKISYKVIFLVTASALTAWLRDTVSVIIHSLMLRVLNTLNGRCAARPIRGVSSPVERLVTVCLRVEANRRAETIMKWFYLYMSLHYSFVCRQTTNYPWSAPMHVGERPTWLNSVALSHDKGLFSEKTISWIFDAEYPFCMHLILREFTF